MSEDYKNDSKSIYYTIRDHNLIVFCNRCDDPLFFTQYIHSDVASWTHGKKQILCPGCATELPQLVYRKVYPIKDISEVRSRFIKENSDEELFWCHMNIKNREDYLCSEHDESLELTNGVPKILYCGCGPQCPDSMKEELKIRKMVLSLAPYELEFLTPCYETDEFHTLIRNLLTYNYMTDFITDTLSLSRGNMGQYHGTIVNAELILRTNLADSGPFGYELKDFQSKIFSSLNQLKFEVTINYFRPNFRILVKPSINLDEGINSIEAKFDFFCDSEIRRIREECLNDFPPVIDDKINGKEIEYIQAYVCPCLYAEPDAIKKPECRHTASIYFKDGTNKFCGQCTVFKNNPRIQGITANQLKEKGYIKYIVQDRPNNDHKFRSQMQLCELSKLISEDKFKKEGYPDKKTEMYHAKLTKEQKREVDKTCVLL